MIGYVVAVVAALACVSDMFYTCLVVVAVLTCYLVLFHTCLALLLCCFLHWLWIRLCFTHVLQY